MRKIVMLIFGVLLACLFVGCAGALSPEAQRVLVVSEKPNDCTALEKVSASITDTSGAMSDGAIRQKAEDDLREKIAKLGGDVAYILGAEKRWDYLLGGYETKMDAEAYKCEVDSMESREMLESPKSNAVESVESLESSP